MQNQLLATLDTLKTKSPFKKISDDGFTLLKETSSIKYFETGERILRHDELSSHVYLILRGEIRLLAKSFENKGLITIEKRGPGQFMGWVSLLRAEACETIQASDDVYALSIPSEVFIRLYKTEPELVKFFENTSNSHEIWRTIGEFFKSVPKRPKDIDSTIKELIPHCVTQSYEINLVTDKNQYLWFLSSSLDTDDTLVGDNITSKNLLDKSYNALPTRLVGIPRNWPEISELTNLKKSKLKEESINNKEKLEVGSQDLVELGIREGDNLTDREKYPLIKGRGTVAEGSAVVEMLAQALNISFRKDLCKKYLGDLEKRNKQINNESMGALCQGMGMDNQIGLVKTEHLLVVDYPAIEIKNGHPRIIWGAKGGELIISDPCKGLYRESINERDPEESIKLLLVKKSVNANSDRFGWTWFTPLVKKYKWSLLLVFGASLLAQLMGLAIPLLFQQIIDKVLNQGNLSTLNVLGGTMVVLALFQGLLTGLRQFIFVDTTDRMDLTLGSAVIDRLLTLPLRYFERRPVGELSQRLGELNTIRGFLTGTALISVMNLFFAALYLVVMFIYSPLLTAIALSTFPIYMILVLVISPIYKQMIRKRAVAAAQTQSHVPSLYESYGEWFPKS